MFPAIKLRSHLCRTIVMLITCALISRFLFSSTFLQFDGNPQVLKQRLSSQFRSTILFNSPIHDELIQLQFPPLRIFPIEPSKSIPKRRYVHKPLPYDEAVFRRSSFPILWLDEQFDVHWNLAAERQMLAHLTEKQFPNLHLFQSSSFDEQTILDTCRERSLFILHQHFSGFFSRVLCFIAQFGQTLYTPRMGVLPGAKFLGGRGQEDDFLSEGITRYFPPFSICSAYMNHRNMTKLKTTIERPSNKKQILRSDELPRHGHDENNRVLFSSDYWKMDYHHVPIRKWLFDRKQSDITYNSSIAILTDHLDEHIYAPGNAQDVTLGEWININRPDAFSSELLPNQGNYSLTWQDHVFGSFLRYIFVLFFCSQNVPRIELSQRILAQYWSSFLIDKYSLNKTTDPFRDLAGLYIRRGDKSVEDSFWFQHHRWRNLSYYVKGLVDEEKQRKRIFKSIFVMTDDVSVMNSLLDYADPQSKGTDEMYARKHLRHRNILYNVLAPQICFDPFRRIGFDQFLVSMRFLIKHSTFTVGHTDSNVFRFFRQVIYAQRQQQPGVQSFTFVRNAPDSL